MSFRTERELVVCALASPAFHILVESDHCLTYHRLELAGLFGIPDLVTVTIDAPLKTVRTIAFEMKLRNWRRALAQAYKYKAFARQAYVVLDHAHVGPAMSQLHLFRRSNIGLLSINLWGDIFVHHVPYEESPYCPQLRGTFQDIFGNETESGSTGSFDPSTRFVPFYSPCLRTLARSCTPLMSNV